VARAAPSIAQNLPRKQRFVGPRDLDSGDGWNDGYEQYKLLIGLSAIVDIVPYKVTNTVFVKKKKGSKTEFVAETLLHDG
jgi:hypothetical protein